MSRLQFTTGAGHRRGRVRQTRPMRSRHPPCRRQQYKKGLSSVGIALGSGKSQPLRITPLLNGKILRACAGSVL